MVKKLIFALFALVLFSIIGICSVMYVQARRSEGRSGQYVALGSSFAAGIGLGQRAPGSPFACVRTGGGYPSILARKLKLSFVDMSCSGSTTTHILKGGQSFLGPQIDAVGAATQLVTITSGGNDVGYVGDLVSAAGSFGPIVRLLVGEARPVDARPFARVTRNIRDMIREVRRRAPDAKVVVVSYPKIMPDHGACARLNIKPPAIDLSRQVGDRLAAATRRAAEKEGAIFVDMGAQSTGHDACSTEPWVNGAAPRHGTAFHPNQAGAQAVADAIEQALAGARFTK